MALGEKLKQARLQAGLSQRQLCEGIVTRNMLSQMENGAANPSLSTLSALAGRLGKPLGYFLEEQEDPGHRLLAAAWECYEDGKMEEAWKNLEMVQEPQGVLFRDYALLTCLTCLELGDKALKNHQLPRAREALSRVEALENQTGCPDYLRTRRLLLQGKDNPAAWNALPSLDEILLAKGEAALLEENPQACRTFLEAMEGRTSRWYLLMGKCALAKGSWPEAAELLHQAESAYPKETAPLLEAAYREAGNYRRAYEYAVAQKKG